MTSRINFQLSNGRMTKLLKYLDDRGAVCPCQLAGHSNDRHEPQKDTIIPWSALHTVAKYGML